mgnify:CR=1 FL=1
MKPICVTCQRFYRCKKSGFYFIEAMPHPGNKRDDEICPGTERPDQWTPYKLWAGDLWECLGCGHTLVSGVGHAPIMEHYQDGFHTKIDQLNAKQLQVNDC